MSGLFYSCAYEPRGAAAAHPFDGSIRRSGPFSLAASGPGSLDAGPTGALCLVDGEIDLGGLAGEVGLPRGAALEQVLVAAHRAHGTGFLARARGTFSLVLWDPARAAGLVATDQLGTRSVFARAVGESILLASELPALLGMLPTRPAPDVGALGRWLTGGLLAPNETLYDGLWRLEGGHAIELAGGRWRVERYWRPRYRPRGFADRRDAAAALRAGVVAAVAGSVAGDGSTGVLLSGGLDSSSVAGAAQPRTPLPAYSVVFPDHPEVDESAQLDVLARRLRAPHTRLAYRGGSLLRGSLEYLRAWESPALSPTFAFMLPLLGLAAADGHRRVVDGEGGDELFGLSPLLLADRLRSGRLLGLAALVRRFPDLGPRPPLRMVRLLVQEYAVKGALPPFLEAGLRRQRGSGPHPWLNEAAAARAGEAGPTWKEAEGPRWWAYLADALTAGRHRMGVHDLLRRRATLAGIEARHPFLEDLDLVELVLSLPPELAFDEALDRPLLREAMQGLVPDAVRLRADKSNFAPLFRLGLAADRPHLAALLSEDAEIRAFLRPEVVDEARRRVEGEVDAGWAWRIWRLSTAECWLRSQREPAFAERALETWALEGGRLEVVPERLGPADAGPRS